MTYLTNPSLVNDNFGILNVENSDVAILMVNYFIGVSIARRSYFFNRILDFKSPSCILLNRGKSNLPFIVCSGFQVCLRHSLGLYNLFTVFKYYSNIVAYLTKPFLGNFVGYCLSVVNNKGFTQIAILIVILT